MVEPIENLGSTARDQLANERTFLAWVRTGLGFVGIGVVLEKLIEERGQLALAMGLLFIGSGITMLAYSFLRYRRIMHLLTHGRFAPAQRGPLALVAFLIALALGAALFMLL